MEWRSPYDINCSRVWVLRMYERTVCIHSERESLSTVSIADRQSVYVHMSGGCIQKFRLGTPPPPPPPPKFTPVCGLHAENHNFQKFPAVVNAFRVVGGPVFLLPFLLKVRTI